MNIINLITFYTFLRDTSHSKYSKREEYRRHVTLVVNNSTKTTELDIDNLGTCEKISFQFFDYAVEFIEGKTEDD